MRKAIKAAAIAVGIAAALNGLFWLVMHIAAETGIKTSTSAGMRPKHKKAGPL